MRTIISDSQHDNRQIAYWLIICSILIFCMVLLGGVTRLTGSGLSMVDWDPIMGVIPPLNEAQWQNTFEKYQQFPEYQKLNKGMSLSEFKSIFTFEYTHRILGRLIGIVFLIPFLYFLLKGKIRRSLTPQLLIMFILGGLQGLLGWYMVKSGLSHNPHVSQYRLAAHLMAAIAIYAYILWTAWTLLSPKAENMGITGIRRLRRLAHITTIIIVIMIISGAFVAGTRAGFTYNTFPLMHGHIIPPGMFALQPFYLNFFENLTTVQFSHRIIAYALTILILLMWFAAKRYALWPRARMIFHLLLLMLVVQVTLGITTLLFVVPVPLAATHQGGALLLFTISLYINHQLRRSEVF